MSGDLKNGLMLLVGIVYILSYMKVVPVDPWLLFGVFVGLLGLMGFVGMGKK